MKKNKLKWILIAITAVIVIALFTGDKYYFGLWPFDKKTEKTKTEIVKPVVPSLNEAGLKDQITNLRIDTGRLGGENRCLKSALADCNGSKTKAIVKTSPTKKPIVKKTTKINSGVVNQPVPIVQSGSPTPVNSGTDNLSYLRDQDGKIIFCVQANGREDLYFPHYAMQHGIVFSNFQNNQIKGYNWDVAPSPKYKGDYGVTNNGIFYVSDVLIRSSLQKGGITLENLSIKCPFTGWLSKQMTQEGEFWIYPTKQN
jgi:hypothetical protein